MKRNLFILSGIGLGAGLAYTLYQDRQAYRRALTHVTSYTPPRGMARWLDSTRGTVQQQARELLPRPRHQRSFYALPAVPQMRRADMVTGLVIIGSLALGAGLMYVLDPDRGRQRRGRFLQAGASSWRRLRSTLRQTSRHLGNRTRGVLSETRRQVRSTETPDDDVLIARVRSQIGHVISHSGAIGVDAHQGRVTLHGSVPADEVDKLLKTVAGVLGVHDVVNQLEIQAQTDNVSGLQGTH
jgi:hypothetical protein